MHSELTLKVSSKGQITLPRQVRQMLGGPTVRLIADTDEGVMLKPMNRVQGALRGYASTDLQEKEESAWAESVKSKVSRP